MFKLSNLRNICPKDDSQINDKSKVSNQKMLDMIKKFKSFVGGEEVTKARRENANIIFSFNDNDFSQS